MGGGGWLAEHVSSWFVLCLKGTRFPGSPFRARREESLHGSHFLICLSACCLARSPALARGCRQNLHPLCKVNGSRRVSPASRPSSTFLRQWMPPTRPFQGARPRTPQASLSSSPDHVGVLEGLQVPQHRHLADGGKRHAFLASLHPHALQRHETASVLKVAGLEHLPIGAFPDLRHALVLLVCAAQAVLLHSARTPPGAVRHRWSGLGARSAGSRPPLTTSGIARPAPSRPGDGSSSPSPLATNALRRSGSCGGRGWMERPPRGRAQPWCRCETPPAESQWSEPIPPLPSPKSSPLPRHRGDYIFSARARLSPLSFHLKEEIGGQEESAIRHPRRLPWGSCRLPSSSSLNAPLLPSARSSPLPGRLILPGSSEKSEVTFLSL